MAPFVFVLPMAIKYLEKKPLCSPSVISTSHMPIYRNHPQSSPANFADPLIPMEARNTAGRENQFPPPRFSNSPLSKLFCRWITISVSRSASPSSLEWRLRWMPLIDGTELPPTSLNTTAYLTRRRSIDVRRRREPTTYARVLHTCTRAYTVVHIRMH